MKFSCARSQAGRTTKKRRNVSANQVSGSNRSSLRRSTRTPQGRTTEGGESANRTHRHSIQDNAAASPTATKAAAKAAVKGKVQLSRPDPPSGARAHAPGPAWLKVERPG